MALADVLVSEARPDLPVRGGALREVGTAGTFQIPVVTPSPRGPETSWRYFSPARCDVRFAPADFRRALAEIDPRLEAVWHPVNERWCVWFRDVSGWKLLFPVQTLQTGAYLPLDARTLAKVWDRCGRRWGSGRAYWDRIESEIVRDVTAKESRRRQEARDAAGDQFDYAQIKVSMCGASNGSKFATHHSGD